MVREGAGWLGRVQGGEGGCGVVRVGDGRRGGVGRVVLLDNVHK